MTALLISFTGGASKHHAALVLFVASLPDPTVAQPYHLYASVPPDALAQIVERIGEDVSLRDGSFVSDEAGYYVEVWDRERHESGYLGPPASAFKPLRAWTRSLPFPLPALEHFLSELSSGR